MKIHPILAALGLASLCISCRLEAPMQRQVVWNVDCDLQVVSLPEELAIPLATDLRDPRRSEEAFKEVQKLIAAKRAILVGWPILTTHSGQRAVIEQIDEFRYATEYQPPSVGITPNQPANQTVKVEPKIDVTAFDSTPTAFETRNVGVTFEVEPVVAPDGETIELNMVPQHVHFLEWTKVTIEQNPPGVKLTVEQPRFVTNKSTTSMTFRNGERKLIGFYKAAEPAGNVELFILRVDALKKKVAVENQSAPLSGSTTSGGAVGP